jgi:hypothetical protein
LHENKTPALAFYAYIDPAGAPVQITTDQSWKSRRAPDGNWRALEQTDADWAAAAVQTQAGIDEGPSLQPVKRADFANIPVDLAPTVVPGISTAAKAAKIRASMLAADPLQTALERPNREVTTAARPGIATTIQALELTNGATLDNSLKEIAAANLAAAQSAPADWSTTFFRRTLGREPSATEKGIAIELLSAKPSAEQVADFVWMIVNHPEFQLIR